MGAGLIILVIILAVGFYMYHQISSNPFAAAGLAAAASISKKAIKASNFNKKSNVTRDDIKVNDEYRGCNKTLKFTSNTQLEYDGSTGTYTIPENNGGEIKGNLNGKQDATVNGKTETFDYTYTASIYIGNNEILFSTLSEDCVMKKVVESRTSGYAPRSLGCDLN